MAIVDDHEDNVAVLRRLLGSAGITRVSCWTDPLAGLDACLSDPPDLLLLDLRMPRLDGFAFIDALQQQLSPDTFLPILVLTADTADDARLDALAVGATDFVTKPFNHAEVLLRVRNLLTTRALYSQVQQHNQRLETKLAQQQARQRQAHAERCQRIQRIHQVLTTGCLTVAVQPIKELASGLVVGVEALTRILDEPVRPPDVWFQEAHHVGLGRHLELAAVAAAVETLDFLPTDQLLAINTSPDTVLAPELASLLRPFSRRIILELTEHAAVNDYSTLNVALDRLRAQGVRLAVDDAGAGYASLQHILKLRPDIIKLDAALTRNIHTDPVRKALAAALVTFASDINATIVAEGIETAQDLETLQHLGIPWGQGYYLGRPAQVTDSRHRTFAESFGRLQLQPSHGPLGAPR